MTDTKQTKSAPKKESQTFGFGFHCGNFKEMFEMMKKCQGGDEGSFDCCAMMQQMCGGTFEEKEAEKP